MGAGLLTAVGASLCCITPVLALIAGTGGIASGFSWLEPLRPYLIGITILVLGVAWYQKLQKKTEVDCECDPEKQSGFMQPKTFLGVVTAFAIIMLAFPYYANVFYPEPSNQTMISNFDSIVTVEFKVSGMSCVSCEEHIDYEVAKLAGIVSTTTSYEDGSSVITFDANQTDAVEIRKAINSTGYEVKDIVVK